MAKMWGTAHCTRVVRNSPTAAIQFRCGDSSQYNKDLKLSVAHPPVRCAPFGTGSRYVCLQPLTSSSPPLFFSSLPVALVSRAVRAAAGGFRAWPTLGGCGSYRSISVEALDRLSEGRSVLPRMTDVAIARKGSDELDASGKLDESQKRRKQLGKDLCEAASEGDLEQLRKIMDSGADANAADYDKRSAMHLASAEGHLAVVQFLVERQADINIKDRWGGYPLKEAVFNGHVEVPLPPHPPAAFRSGGSPASHNPHNVSSAGAEIDPKDEEALSQELCKASAKGQRRDLPWRRGHGVEAAGVPRRREQPHVRRTVSTQPSLFFPPLLLSFAVFLSYIALRSRSLRSAPCSAEVEREAQVRSSAASEHTIAAFMCGSLGHFFQFLRKRVAEDGKD
eukprot:294836-Rhodomonas_salina.1